MRDLWRVVGYLRHYWRTALGAFISVLVVSVTNLINPQILRAVVDQGITPRDTRALVVASVAMLLLAIVRDIFTFTQGYWSEKASQGVAYDLRNIIFSHLERLSFSYHDRQQVGQLMTRVTSDVDIARVFAGQSLIQLVNAVVLLIGSAIILITMNWRLALISLAMVPLIALVFGFFIARIAPLFRVVQQKLGNLNTILQENLSGIRVVKAFAREPYELGRYRAANTDLLTQNITVTRATSRAFPLIFFIANLATLAVIGVGGAQVIGGTLTVGELLAFNAYLAYLAQPIFILGGTVASLAQSGASAKRIFEVIDAPIEVRDKPDAVEMTHIHGRVTFDHVSFRYAGSDLASLSDVSFTIEQGQTVAILGRTGSGKSTLINLIPRFYDVTSGRVLIDQYDVRDVTQTSLRHYIGIVLQDTTLFSGTIRANIAYGRSDATEDEVIAAAKLAQADAFIQEFPTGYDTIIGERGVGLSGGQKQRIAIARTLLLDPPLLILDDSTSALDAETEYQIQQALNILMVNRTSFVIAQRISTVRDANVILLMDGGRLVAQGTHEALLRDSELYNEIVQSQLRNDTVAAFATASEEE
jgi:ATP-binding cassette subfamily B protein